MADNGNSSKAELLATLVAAGATIRDACQQAGMSERQAYRLAGQPAFRARVAALRQQAIQAATGRLASLLAGGLDALQGLFIDPSPQVRLGAVRTALEHALRFREAVETEERLRAVEAKLGLVEGHDDGKHGTSAPPGT